MIEDIIEPTMDYDFSNLYLAPPTTLSGGAYFTKILHNNNKSLYVQTPKSITKQGFVKSGKKMYVDLMLNNNDTVFINWIENLENRCQSLIFSKTDTWFETKLEKDDIENAFTSPLKIFKSGKYYLLRANVKPTIKMYDDNNKVIKLEDITVDNHIISILEIQGIKFSSRNFQIEFDLKQSMTVSLDPFLDECFIKKPIARPPTTHAVMSNEAKINMDNFINDTVNDLNKLNAHTIEKTFIDLDKHSEPLDIKKDKYNPTTVIVDTIYDDFDNETNIDLNIEELTDVDNQADNSILKEFELNFAMGNDLETITLKKPNQVYYDIYNKAKDAARQAKQTAIVAYNEVKNIKQLYMLNDSDDSDIDIDDDDFTDNNSDTNIEEDKKCLKDENV